MNIGVYFYLIGSLFFYFDFMEDNKVNKFHTYIILFLITLFVIIIDSFMYKIK